MMLDNKQAINSLAAYFVDEHLFKGQPHSSLLRDKLITRKADQLNFDGLFDSFVLKLQNYQRNLELSHQF